MTNPWFYAVLVLVAALFSEQIASWYRSSQSARAVIFAVLIGVTYGDMFEGLAAALALMWMLNRGVSEGLTGQQHGIGAEGTEVRSIGALESQDQTSASRADLAAAVSPGSELAAKGSVQVLTRSALADAEPVRKDPQPESRQQQAERRAAKRGVDREDLQATMAPKASRTIPVDPDVMKSSEDTKPHEGFHADNPFRGVRTV
jgi:hypothetical protein